MADPMDPIDALSDTLSKIYAQLDSGDPPSQSADWNTLSLKAQLIDQQLTALVHKQFQDDDATFKTTASELSSATQELDKVIATTHRVDQIINIVDQISATADELINLA